MIAKGNLHAHGQKLAAYLITGKKFERAELAELRGFASSNIREAFIDVMIQSEATRCEKPFFHAQVRLPQGDSLDRARWIAAADRIEQQLGFDGQGRAVAFHHDRRNGETHMHIAWSRIHLEQMRSIDPGLYKNKLKEISRQLEHEFDLTRVRNERPEQQQTRAPGRAEEEQSRRLGTDLRAIREAIRDCWDRSDNGHSFEAALAERGLVLARGDRRDFVVVDQAGGDHALGKRITGNTAAETRARLADIDKAHLPSVDQAKMQAERAQLAPAPELPPTAARAENERPAESFTAAARAAFAQAGAAPEPVQQREWQDPAHAPEPGRPTSAPPREAGIREAGDVADRVSNGFLSGVIGRALDGLAGLFEGLFATPPPPPTKEEVHRAERVEEEREQKVEDRTQRAKADDDLRLRLEQQIKDDLARQQRERDDEHYRGRSRER